ncbi:hypothetical protein DXG03_001406 [Asterophora parasitica]|uniref:RanBD1 domain-containing protein n=1 Tax=Asterophora parasitica TaxID=117018 RepID=A0A9P7KCM0_9AGAR|nr:hypothetical protein DXG03_001406 [Asterophora parasitica]
MKRGAEKYLIKDRDEDDEDDAEEPTEGFRKADDAVLASRPCVGTDARTTEAFICYEFHSDDSDSDDFNIGVQKFASFSGFASPSFPPPLSTTPALNSFSPAHSAPAVATSASNTAKTFASFLSPVPSKPESTSPKSAFPSTPSSTSETTDVDDPALLKYYTSLRGLNVSLLDVVSKATEKDPFVDISDLLDQYKSLRLDVQKEFDDKSKKPSPATAAAAPPKPTSMPAPPTSFAGFGKPSPSTSTSSGGNGGGFQPKLTSSSSTPASGFTFTPSATPPTTTASGFSFAVPPPTQASTSANPFVLTPSSGSVSPFGGSLSNSPSPFGEKISAPAPPPFGGSFSATSAANSDAEKSTSLRPFGSFGAPSGATTAKSAFGSTDKSTQSSSFAFGAPSASSTSTSAFGITGSSSSSNVFGSDKPSFSTSPAAAAKPQAFGGFGGFGSKPGGSIGNPVGFGFGSPPKPGADDASSLEAADKKGSEDTATTSQEDDSDKPPPTFGLNSKSPHDEEGEGEEDEETVHSAKLKAFRLSKPESGPATWAELGIGVLRLKKHKTKDARRILLRNSSTGKVNINFSVYSGLKPTQTKKALTFVGHDATGASQTYSVRLQSEDQAKTLKEALDREIAFVKGKSDN